MGMEDDKPMYIISPLQYDRFTGLPLIRRVCLLSLNRVRTLWRLRWLIRIIVVVAAAGAFFVAGVVVASIDDVTASTISSTTTL